MNSDHDANLENPFHDGLTVLARIISRAYRWNLLISNLYVPLGAALSYCGRQYHFEWNLTGADGISYRVTADTSF